ncbi:hypothetical protein [Mycobacterium riyadhense]|uniref:hypothetical protein n=1 Tax=Mycobacterium riyadhense TaxID=486698 RepID=UPI0026AC75C7
MRRCRDTAGSRIHGTTCARPLEVFTAEEQPQLLPVALVYDVPVFKTVKVHRDFHAEVAKALYSLPECRIDEVYPILYIDGLRLRPQWAIVSPSKKPGSVSTSSPALRTLTELRSSGADFVVERHRSGPWPSPAPDTGRSSPHSSPAAQRAPSGCRGHDQRPTRRGVANRRATAASAPTDTSRIAHPRQPTPSATL